VIFVGVDWAEAHHDVCILDGDGTVLGRRKIGDSFAGVGELHALVAAHLGDDDEADQVVVGIEKDRGLIVTALVAANYQVYGINPMAAARYRERHHVSGSKSDPGDAKMLADLVRTDRQNHRQVAGDSALINGVQVLARAHQNAIWSRQRQVNALRSGLKDYYPGALEAFGTDLSHMDAVAVLSVAPTPAIGRTLTRAKLVVTLKRGGRQRKLDERAEKILTALRKEQLGEPQVLEDAYGKVTSSIVRTIALMSSEIAELEKALSESFEQHPSAKIVRSLPGMGTVLGARVLGEFGDDPNRYFDAKSRRNYAGTSPVTKASPFTIATPGTDIMMPNGSSAFKETAMRSSSSWISWQRARASLASTAMSSAKSAKSSWSSQSARDSSAAAKILRASLSPDLPCE
jgi:hypothetical protein